ncbi:hypothetical protein N0V82_006098 [Gnomoniopsis sp. IMI 355080]|nr:hypothetical protein N0V82_006098 [Gnomoniopsis sp. IMI 355080]
MATHLDSDHHEIFVRALRHVLSTELAETTMAQLIDGLPLAEVVYNMRANLAYQDAAPCSHPFKMRLIELVASSIHQIAVLLFNNEPKLHNGDVETVVSWKAERREVVNPDGLKVWEGQLYPPHPTLFFHSDYEQYELYPNGLAEAAGYWAEDQIFGGVVLFDRGESGVEASHSNTTFRIWQPLETQFNALIDFLLADKSQETPPPSPFPLMASDDNRHRYDPWIAMDHHIYRDAWELDLPPREDYMSWRDCISTGDYPELEDMFTKIQAVAEGPCLDPDAAIPSAPPSPFLDPDHEITFAALANSSKEALDDPTQSQPMPGATDSGGEIHEGAGHENDDAKKSLSELTFAKEHKDMSSLATESDAGLEDTAHAGQGGTMADGQAKSTHEQ